MNNYANHILFILYQNCLVEIEKKNIKKFRKYFEIVSIE